MPAPRFDQLHRQPGPYFVALGGAGMFGANLYLYGSGGEWIAIDCGFALESTPSGDSRVAVPLIEALEKHDIKLSARSEEHTSELQSRPHLVCRLLLEKKNHI